MMLLINAPYTHSTHNTDSLKVGRSTTRVFSPVMVAAPLNHIMDDEDF